MGPAKPRVLSRALPTLLIALILASGGSVTSANGGGRHDCPEKPNLKRTGPFNADRVVGHSVKRAESIAERHGCSIRVVKRNGEFLNIDDDYRNNRINVAVRERRIKRVLGVN